MNPVGINALLDGQFKICWQGIEFKACFWRGGTRSPDFDEREFETNCGTAKTLKKIKKVTFSTEFTSWDTNHLALLAQHLGNGTTANSNGLILTTAGCTSDTTSGPLYIEFLCADGTDGSNKTIFYPNATINLMEEDIDFTDDGGVVVSVSWDAFPADDNAQFPDVVEIIGQPDPTQAMVFDCATGTWVNA